MAGPEPEATVDQRALVERAAQGDQDAFAQLVHDALPRLDTAARLIVRDPELARDAVQDALLRCWRDLRSLREPERFNAWLYKLTVNACIDEHRRRRRRPIEIEITALHTPLVPDPSTAVAERDSVDRVLRALDPNGRAIIVLHYYLGLPLTDVAGAVGVPVGTVKSRLNRALGQMRTVASIEAPITTGIVPGRYPA